MEPEVIDVPGFIEPGDTETPQAVPDLTWREEQDHETAVKAYLDEHDKGDHGEGWAKQKGRRWHFDNPNGRRRSQGGTGRLRYFQREREREVHAFGPEPDDEESSEWATWNRVDAEAALAAEPSVDRPRLTPEQRVAKRMVELAQGAYSHRTVWELAELAWEEQTKKATPKPVKTARDYKALAAVLRAILRDLKPVAAERRIAKLLGVKESTVHTHLARWREESLGDEWTTETVESQKTSNGEFMVVVPLAR